MPLFQEELVVTLEHFARAAKLHNTWYDRHPLSAEEIQTFTREEPDVPRRHALLVEGGEDRVYCSVIQAHWAEETDNFFWEHWFDRAHWTPVRADAALHWAETHARSLGASALQCWSESYRPEHVAWLLGQGFAPGQTNPVTLAPLNELPLDEWAAHHPVPSGMRMMSSADLRDAYPERWRTMIYEFNNSIMADVPSPSPYVAPTLEQFVKEHLESPLVRLETQLYLVEGDELVAGTAFYVNRLNPKIADTGLTGTRRSHRRQGLARIIKIASMQVARQIGVEELETDNEQANPMLNLNLELGFRQDHTVTHYTRRLQP